MHWLTFASTFASTVAPGGRPVVLPALAGAGLRPKPRCPRPLRRRLEVTPS